MMDAWLLPQWLVKKHVPEVGPNNNVHTIANNMLCYVQLVLESRETCIGAVKIIDNEPQCEHLLK
jgi:hypothetical protein